MTELEKAYIAGFLEADGCIMLQLVYRHDYILGYQIRASIVFYQKSKYKPFLNWLKSKLAYGYIRDRNDGMSEYTIVGYRAVEKVINDLKPYLRIKRQQAEIVLDVIQQTPRKKRRFYTPAMLLKLAKEVDKFIDLNYSKKRKNTSKEVYYYLLSHKLISP